MGLKVDDEESEDIYEEKATERAGTDGADDDGTGAGFYYI
jgi:hypothetical protein